MAIHLLCLTTTGLPIFTRKKGECENLPFSTVASLNGFHVFFKSLGIKLQTTHAENDWIYLWQDFHNAITIISCGRGLGEIVLQRLSELTNAAISLFVSRDEMAHSALLERIKKDLKYILPIIEAAMDASLCLMPGFSDCVLAMENSQLLQKLNDFSNQCGSLFCNLVIDQRLIVATEGWWDLNVLERELLMLLLNSSSSMQNDIPIYLPQKSPNVAFRFVSIPLAPNAVLCVICGSGPAYSLLHKTTQNIFKNEILQLVQNVERCLPRSIPDQFEIDENVLAMILTNLDTKKFVFSRNMQKSTIKRLSTTAAISAAATTNCGGSNAQSLTMLKKFFFQTIEAAKFLECNDEGVNGNGNPNADVKKTKIVADQYWCSDYHKCFAALSLDCRNVIFVLFVASVPTHTMKFIAQKLLNSLIQEKSFCW